MGPRDHVPIFSWWILKGTLWNTHLKEQQRKQRTGLEVTASPGSTSFSRGHQQLEMAPRMDNILRYNFTNIGLPRPVVGQVSIHWQVNKDGVHAEPIHMIVWDNKFKKGMPLLQNYYPGKYFIMVSMKNCDSKKRRIYHYYHLTEAIMSKQKERCQTSRLNTVSVSSAHESMGWWERLCFASGLAVCIHMCKSWLAVTVMTDVTCHMCLITYPSPVGICLGRGRSTPTRGCRRGQGFLRHRLRTTQVTSASTSTDQSKWQAPPRFKRWRIRSHLLVTGAARH